MIRRLAHEPYGWRPTILRVSVRRYRCPECAHVWRQDMSAAADPRAKLSRVAPHPVRRQIRHRYLGLDSHPRPQRPLPALGYGPGLLQKRSSKPGWPPSPIRGAAVLRSSRWMDSPGSRAPLPKNSPTQGQSWIPSTSYTWLVKPWMSASDAFSKNSTTGAGVPPTPCTRPAGCCTPDLVCSRHASSTNSSTFCHRGARCPRSHLERLSEYCRRLPRARHGRGQGPHGSRN